MKGILLVGGSGSRLAPITIAIPKSLLPVWNKPMVYYALSSILQAGIREVLVISTPQDRPAFSRLLGDGSQFGCSFTYAIQERAEGIAQAWTIARDWLDGHSSCLALGDNILYGDGIGDLLSEAAHSPGACIFGYHVANPTAYGVVEVSKGGNVAGIEEKPQNPKSNLAIPGIYFVDERAPEIVSILKPSPRGEFEVTDLLKSYLPSDLRMIRIRRGFAWLDAGTPDSLLDASNFIATLERRCGLPIGDPYGIARDRGWIK